MLFLKKTTNLIILVVIFFFSVNPIFAIEEDAVLTLEDCINIALKSSPNVKKYKNYIYSYKSKVGQAKSDYFPTVNLNGGYYYQGEHKNKGLGSSNSQYYGASTGLNQLIYNFGKTGASIKKQKYYLLAAEMDFDTEILNTVYDVRSCYYGVLSASAKVDIQKAYVQINERLYQRTKAFFDEGLKSKIDLVNAEVNLSDSKISLITAQNDYETSIVKLNNAMYASEAPAYRIASTETFNLQQTYKEAELLKIANFDDKHSVPTFEKNAVYSTSVEKTDILNKYEFKKYPYSFEESVKIANENRPDLKSYEAIVHAMEQALKYAKREYFPAINAGVGYNIKNHTDYLNNGFNVSASLDFPLINGMNTKYKIDEAKAQLEIAKNELEEISKNIFFEVQSNYINMLQLEKKIPLLEVKVRQTLENFELADGRYEVGLGNFIELQDAKVNYNNAQQTYVQTIYDYNVARAKLELSIAFPEEFNKYREEK